VLHTRLEEVVLHTRLEEEDQPGVGHTEN
jgi:hypothetical protein